MSLAFHKQLAVWLSEKEISRKDFIALLQNKYHSEFSGLDSVTLSRWIKGHSTPSVGKQLYIAKSLNVNMVDLVSGVEFSKRKTPVKHDTLISELAKSLDKTMSYLSYDVVTGDADMEVKALTHSEYIQKFGNFDKNASALKDYYDELNNLGKGVNYSCILIKNESDNIIGHWSGIADIRKLISFKSLNSIPKQDFETSCIIHLGKYTSSRHYFELIYQALCLFLCKYSHRLDKAYFFIPDFTPMVLFCKLVLRAKVIKYFPSSTKSETGAYLLSFDILKVIASPIIVHEVKSRIVCAINCDPKCSKCNLATLL